MFRHYLSFLTCLLLFGPLPVLAETPTETAKENPPPLSAMEWRLYQALSKHIKDSHITSVDDATLFQGCLSGMAGGLDPYSSYLDTKAFDEMKGRTDDTAEIGLELGMRIDRAQVLRVLANSPAAQADIRRGDVIVRIDGKVVVGQSLVDVGRRLRSKPETEVHLLLQREGVAEPLQVALKRVILPKQKTVQSRRLEPGYGYTQVGMFLRATPDEFVAALEALADAGKGADKAKLQGLILDLRDNPGGLLEQATAFAGAFLPSDALIARTEGRTPDADKEYRTSVASLGSHFMRYWAISELAQSLPLVVLINGETAAGAELVAGALRDHGRAVLVGMATFGRDTLQAVTPMRGYGAIKLSTQRWFTPKGHSSFPDGLAPDIVVTTADYDSTTQDDPTLQRGLAVLKEKTAAAQKAAAERAAAIKSLRKSAMVAMTKHDWDQAYAHWSQLLTFQPDDAHALRLRGSVQAEQGKAVEADLDLERAIELQPESSNAWNSLCWGRILAGRFTEARTACERSLALDPDELAPQINLAHTYLLQGDTVNAWMLYSKATPFIADEAELKRGPLADFERFKQRGWQTDILDAERDRFSAQARDWLSRRAKADALRAEAHMADAAQDRPAELRLRIERLAELEKLLYPTHGMVIRAVEALADTYVQAGQPDQALPLYQRVLQHRQNLTGAEPKPLIAALGKLLTTVNAIEHPDNTGDALEAAFSVVERIFGPEADATISLAARLAQVHIDSETASLRALELAERVATQRKRSAASVEVRLNAELLRLWALTQLDHHAEAIEVIEGMRQLVDTGPNHAPARFVQFTEIQADIYLMNNQPDLAIAGYEQVLAARQGDDEATLAANIDTLRKAAKLLSLYDRAGEAKPYLEKALALAEKRYGKEGDVTRQIVDLLEDLRE